MEDAKNKLNGYFQNLSKVKFNPVPNSTANVPKNNANADYGKAETTVVPYLDVGYSFASNIVDDPRKD
jgi:hypothetical protein